MEPKKKETDATYWHPAFFADIQIELKDDADNLIFENEHQLGKNPMEIDVLIIKKEKARPVKKNIGRIFKKYNIVEYKGPGDSLSIDDYYKVYGYTCFYKADVPYVNSISVNELTITFVSEKYPRKLIQHLETVRNFVVEITEPGIYFVKGDIIPIQIIVTGRLSETENLWLKSLTNNLRESEKAKKLIEDYLVHTDNNLYHSVLDTIMRANQKTFEEVNGMTDIVMEIVREKFDRKLKEKLEEELPKAVERELSKAVERELEKELPKALARELEKELEIELPKAVAAAVRDEQHASKKKIDAAKLTERISLIQKKYRKNKPLTVIADEMETTAEEILSIYNAICKNPEKTAEEICNFLSSQQETC